MTDQGTGKHRAVGFCVPVGRLDETLLRIVTLFKTSRAPHETVRAFAARTPVAWWTERLETERVQG